MLGCPHIYELRHMSSATHVYIHNCIGKILKSHSHDIRHSLCVVADKMDMTKQLMGGIRQFVVLCGYVHVHIHIHIYTLGVISFELKESQNYLLFCYCQNLSVQHSVYHKLNNQYSSRMGEKKKKTKEPFWKPVYNPDS